MDRKLRSVAERIYPYHNLGIGLFPEGEEKTPYGAGERYNFDRMYMLVSSYDFTRKRVADLGCNSGWFCLQAKLLGASVTVGVDYEGTGMMGEAIAYAEKLEKRLKLGMKFENRNLEDVDVGELAGRHGEDAFDATLVLSVLHHIQDRPRLMASVFENTRDVVFYEDHEFWNELYGADGEPLEVRGEGYRFGWNEDLSWQRKMGSLDRHESLVLEAYRDSWRAEALGLDRYREVRLLGFSEKRRPVLGLFK